jgi:hypothetical protein
MPQAGKTTAKTVAIEVSHASRAGLREVTAQMRNPSAPAASATAATAAITRRDTPGPRSQPTISLSAPPARQHRDQKAANPQR